MNKDTRVCRDCREAKPVNDFCERGRNIKTGKQYYMLECKPCAAIQRRTAYHSDGVKRSLQVMYSMETHVKKVYPHAWFGSIASPAAEKLRAARRCEYCEAPNDGGFVFSLDHHMPLALGGSHTLENLKPCCEPCNRAKHDMPPHAFKAWMDALVFRLAWLRAQ